MHKETALNCPQPPSTALNCPQLPSTANKKKKTNWTPIFLDLMHPSVTNAVGYWPIGQG